MILPSKWQQTFGLAQSRVIGDTNTAGTSTFRNNKNKESTTIGKMDFAYSWAYRYQSGVSFKYQNKNRNFNGSKAEDTGWSDVGLSHAYMLKSMVRAWIFQTLNIPTARSIYDSKESFSVDAQGVGTYQTGLGFFYIKNFKEWDFIVSPELHHSFGRTFKSQNQTKEIKDSQGGSLTAGLGYIPWRSKLRYGMNLTPRIESAKHVRIDNKTESGEESMVWDSNINLTYSLNSQYSFGLNYIDQTIMGPARNTVLNRTVSFIFQTRWL